MSRRDQIIDVARELLERGSPDGITMQAIADHLEIRSPSLYKHVRNKHDVEIALIGRGFAEQADEFANAIADTPDPVTAIAKAYRSWALANPHLYGLMTANPIPRDRNVRRERDYPLPTTRAVNERVRERLLAANPDSVWQNYHLIGTQFVAINEESRPTAVRPLLLDNEEDRQRFRDGERRREVRQALDRELSNDSE